jgi:hypothetical protein
MTTKLYNLAQITRLNSDPGVVGNTDSAQKIVKVYQGQACTLRFAVYNIHNKPLSLSGNSFIFKIWDTESNTLLLTKTVDCAEPYQVQILFAEDEMLNYEAGDYVYTCNVVTGENENLVLYTDTHTEHRGTLRLIKVASNSFVETTELAQFSLINSEYVSSAVNRVDRLKQYGKLHTMTYHPVSYTGTIAIQGTLQNSGTTTGPTDWDTVSTIALSNDSTPKHLNFSGKYSQIRFVHTPSISNTGSITKILYRS